jgi:hypothetical protein
MSLLVMPSVSYYNIDITFMLCFVQPTCSSNSHDSICNVSHHYRR